MQVIDELPDRLRKERQRLGLTQEQVAQVCEVTKDMWSKYERGMHKPKRLVLDAFSRQLGADLDYLVTGTYSVLFEAMVKANPPPKHFGNLVAVDTMDEDEQGILRSYRLCPASIQAAMTKICRALPTADADMVDTLANVIITAIVHRAPLMLVPRAGPVIILDRDEQGMLADYRASSEKFRVAMLGFINCADWANATDNKIGPQGFTATEIELVQQYRAASDEIRLNLRLLSQHGASLMTKTDTG